MDNEGLVDDDWCAAMDLLHVADDVEMLKKLIRTQHIHASDMFGGRTLLHWACAFERVRSAGWMLESGANKEARSICGRTPLHLAASNGHAGCVSLLLRHVAHVDPVSEFGWTPLGSAMRYDHQQSGRLLLDAGANVELARGIVKIPPWVFDFLRARQACAKAVIAFVGGSDRQYRDMARLIGMLIWNTRGAEEWDLKNTQHREGSH